jgi:hypothetical protein
MHGGGGDGTVVPLPRGMAVSSSDRFWPWRPDSTALQGQ